MCHWPAGWEGGAKGSPESEDLRRRTSSDFLAEGGFVFRRLWLFMAAPAVALALVPVSAAARVHVRVEGKTRTIFGASQPALEGGANALTALDAASALGEFFVHLTTTSFGPYVDQIGRYPASGQTGWVFKVNGVSPPVGADQVTLHDGDNVLWYWAQFGVAGGPKTLVLSRAGRNCYRVQAQADNGSLTAAIGAVLHVGTRRIVRTQGATQAAVGCVRRHPRLLVRATLAGAVRSNALP
jgi:hypothetical protein